MTSEKKDNAMSLLNHLLSSKKFTLSLEGWLRQQSACFPSTNPEFKPVSTKKEEKKGLLCCDYLLHVLFSYGLVFLKLKGF
jgi:hypothetical protein